MLPSYQELCETYHFNQEGHLNDLKIWCQNHVSSDVVFHGTTSELHKQYLALAKAYLSDFLAELSMNKQKITTKFDHLTPIQYASLKGYDHYVLEEIARSPAALNQATPSGMTLLHLAALGGNLSLVKGLLKNGADPLKTNASQQLPIFSALIIPMNGTNELMTQKQLIFKCLNSAAPGTLTHQDTNSDNVIHLMATYGYDSLCAEWLAETPNAKLSPNKLSKFPIHTAILNNRINVVITLLNIPNVTQLTDSRGQNALHYAARYGSPDMVELCAKASVDINAVDQDNKTAWMLAAKSKNLSALPILVHYGADKSEPDSSLLISIF